jgi:hypothetical protein
VGKGVEDGVGLAMGGEATVESETSSWDEQALNIISNTEKNSKCFIACLF